MLEDEEGSIETMGAYFQPKDIFCCSPTMDL